MRIIAAFLSLFFLFALLTGGGALWFYGQIQAAGPLQEEKRILIERGSGVQAIAAKLEKENVIRDAFLFRVAARVTGRQGGLKAGEYLFPAQINLSGVLALLHEGRVFPRHVTVPEGLTVYEIVALLNETEGLTGEIGHDLPPEGALLPETYQYIYGDDRTEILQRMEDAMTRTLAALWPNRADDLPFDTKEEAVILASIVEKETSVPAERGKVAGVFINRLRIGMKLQTDPTVIYGLTEGKPQRGGQGPLGRRLLRRDLAFDSPYNTYLYEGLPPGPIANPGRDSLMAVLNPERHDYLYFVADGTGGHAFGKTLEEHNRNVRHWRRVRPQ